MHKPSSQREMIRVRSAPTIGAFLKGENRRMLLTAKELAKALDVHITTIRRAYRTKRIPYERFYKLYFFDLKKVRSTMRRDSLNLTAPRESGTAARDRRRQPAARPAKSPRTVKRGRNFQGS